MVDKFYEAMELPIMKLVKWFDKRKLDRAILSYKKKLVDGWAEK